MEVTEVTFEDRHETVYNMEVADYHTYYAGEDCVWVHNRYGQQGRSKKRVSSRAEGTIQYERLKSEYTADEIIHADRVGSGLNDDPMHRAASYLSKEQLANGRTYSFTGGDGRSYTLLQTKGQYNEIDGIFEYITNDMGQVTHQRFIPGGIYTGFPNQRVPVGGY